MKIGLVCPYSIFKGGGVQECVMALKDELNKRGHEALIITPKPIGSDKTEPDDVLFIGSSVNVNSPFQATTAQGSIKVDLRELSPVLDEHKFDVLHFHEPEVPFLSRQIMSKSTSAHVGTFHAKMPNTLLGKSVEKVITPYTKSIMKCIQETTAVSEAASEYVSSVSKVDITIVPNGVSLSKFKKPASKKKNQSKKIILYVGRLERRKGLKYLLMAFEQLLKTDPDVILKIAGDGADRQKLETLVKDKNIKNVEFLGYVSEDEKIRLLHEATVFCSPAIFGESFGIVLLEAMAAGAVTVAGDNVGYSSVMKGQGKLSLVNPKDTSDFARRLDLLLHDEDLRRLWLKWANEYIKQFDYKNITDQYEQIYKQALKRTKKN